jgi:hypothetical protein
MESYGQWNESTLDKIIKRLRWSKVYKKIPDDSFLVDFGVVTMGTFKCLVKEIRKGSVSTYRWRDPLQGNVN